MVSTTELEIPTRGREMPDGAKERWVITVAAVVMLIGAAILWWDLTVDGFTPRRTFTAGLFTVLGVFWLFVRSRPAKREEAR